MKMVIILSKLLSKSNLLD